MAQLTVQTIADAGVIPAYAAVNASDAFVDDGSGRTFLHVKNGGGSSINVTVPAVKTTTKVPGVGDVTIANIVVAVANGAEKMIGPFTEAYRDASGNVTAQYSATTSVTAGAFKCAKED